MVTDFLKFAVESFAFLIRGEGNMSGREFADKIRRAYDCFGNPQNRECANYIERHVDDIVVYNNGRAIIKTITL